MTAMYYYQSYYTVVVAGTELADTVVAVLLTFDHTEHIGLQATPVFDNPYPIPTQSLLPGTHHFLPVLPPLVHHTWCRPP